MSAAPIASVTIWRSFSSIRSSAIPSLSFSDSGFACTVRSPAAIESATPTVALRLATIRLRGRDEIADLVVALHRDALAEIAERHGIGEIAGLAETARDRQRDPGSRAERDRDGDTDDRHQQQARLVVIGQGSRLVFGKLVLDESRRDRRRDP